MENKCILCKNKAERDAVLAKLEEQDYAWCSGKKPTKWNSQFWDDDDAVAICIGKFGTHSVSWVSATDSYIENHKDDAITASKFLRNSTRPILITRKGRVVTAENKNTGKKAIATCSPTDTFDFGTGAMIAVARLIAQGDKGITKDAETVLRQLLGYDAEPPADIPTEEEPKPFKVGSLVTLRPDVTPGIEYNGLMLKPGEMYDIACGKPIKVIRYDSGDQTYLCEAKGANRMWWYDNGNYKGIKIAEHESNGRTLAYIEQCDGFVFNKCYLVEVKGLEKVTK